MNTSALRGKVAVVTGASSGIGRATALALARAGVNLVLAARNRGALEKVQQEVQALSVAALVVPTDVTERVQVERLVRESLGHYGAIDILVANAGLYFRCPVLELKIEDIERVMAVNFYGAVYGVLQVLAQMRERKAGHIVVVSSMDGKKGLPPDGAYVASKFAVTGLMEVLRQELRGTGVHVSTVFPSRTDTPMIAGLSVPLISAKLPPEQVAGAIVRAILTRQAEVYVPYLGCKALILVNSISSRLGDFAVRFLRLSGWERASRA